MDRLPTVSASDLLGTLNVSTGVVSVLGQHKPTSVAEWTSILNVSHQWKFDAIFELATKKLNELGMDPVEKIILWKKFGLNEEYLRDSYLSIVSQQDPLTMEEVELIGVSTVYKFYAAEKRYGAIRNKKVRKSEESSDVLTATEKVEGIVEDIFYRS